MLDPRAIALQGIGFLPFSMAAQGLSETVSSVATVANSQAGSIVRRSGGRRRVLPCVPTELEEIEQSVAIEAIAFEDQPLPRKRNKSARELEHLLLLH